MKKVIGIDFDDVVADSLAPFLEYCNGVFGTNFKKEELVHADFSNFVNTQAANSSEFAAFF